MAKNNVGGVKSSGFQDDDTKLTTIAAQFLAPTTAALRSRCVRLSVGEEAIVAALNRLVGSHPAVAFGSYPVTQGRTRTILTLEAAGDDEGAVAIEEATEAMLAALPDGALLEVSESAYLSE